MTIGEYILNFEREISNEEFVEAEKEKLLKLSTVEEVVKYYTEDRGWGESKSLTSYLIDLIVDLYNNKETISQSN